MYLSSGAGDWAQSLTRATETMPDSSLLFSLIRKMENLAALYYKTLKFSRNISPKSHPFSSQSDQVRLFMLCSHFPLSSVSLTCISIILFSKQKWFLRIFIEKWGDMEGIQDRAYPLLPMLFFMACAFLGICQQYNQKRKEFSVMEWCQGWAPSLLGGPYDSKLQGANIYPLSQWKGTRAGGCHQGC